MYPSFKIINSFSKGCKGIGIARIILFLCLVCFLHPTPSPANPDNRNISATQWQQLKVDKAFGYKNDKEIVSPPIKNKPNPFEKLIMALLGFFGSNFGNILVWIIVICAAIYIIYRLAFTSDSFLFSRSKKMMNEQGQPQQEDEDIATTNWETLMQNAIKDNDVRPAVRYSYMWLLQMLQQRQLIQYRNDKTNYEYYTELNDTHYKQSFKQLSRQYEYAWYGRFSLPPDAFNEYLTLFNNVRKQLGA